MMKAFLVISLSIFLVSCEYSEGSKFGTLQKVSHKTFPCNYYEIQVAYEGGKAIGGRDKAYQNTQDIKIDKPAFDTLQKHVGANVVFDYKDHGFAICGSSKSLTAIKIR